MFDYDFLFCSSQIINSEKWRGREMFDLKQAPPHTWNNLLLSDSWPVVQLVAWSCLRVLKALNGEVIFIPTGGGKSPVSRFNITQPEQCVLGSCFVSVTLCSFCYIKTADFLWSESFLDKLWKLEECDEHEVYFYSERRSDRAPSVQHSTKVLGSIRLCFKMRRPLPVFLCSSSACSSGALKYSVFSQAWMLYDLEGSEA